MPGAPGPPTTGPHPSYSLLFQPPSPEIAVSRTMLVSAAPPRRVTSSVASCVGHARGPQSNTSWRPIAPRKETNMSDSNAMIIRKVYQDFARGDISAVFAAFDASIAWHVPGHSPLSGDYNGHDQIGGFFRRTMELSGCAVSIDVHHVLAEGDLVV